MSRLALTRSAALAVASRSSVTAFLLAESVASLLPSFVKRLRASSVGPHHRAGVS